MEQQLCFVGCDVCTVHCSASALSAGLWARPLVCHHYNVHGPFCVWRNLQKLLDLYYWKFKIDLKTAEKQQPQKWKSMHPDTRAFQSIVQSNLASLVSDNTIRINDNETRDKLKIRTSSLIIMAEGRVTVQFGFVFLACLIDKFSEIFNVTINKHGHQFPNRSKRYSSDCHGILKFCFTKEPRNLATERNSNEWLKDHIPEPILAEVSWVSECKKSTALVYRHTT